MRGIGKRASSSLLKLTLLASVAVLSGCATMDEIGIGTSASSGSEAQPLKLGKLMIPKDRIRTEPQGHVAIGLEHLQAGRFDEATQEFNNALRLDTTNWIARYHLGLLELDQKNYKTAQGHFAETLIYRNDDPDVLYSMVIASYYARDVPTAADMLKRLRAVEDDTVRVLRASAIVAAALDQPEEAELYIALYEKATKDAAGRAQIERRTADWGRFHDNFQQYVQKAQFGGGYGGFGGGTGGFGGSTQAPVINPPSISPQGAQSGGFGGGFGGFGATTPGFGTQPAAAPAPAQPGAPGAPQLEDMVIVDVVIISTEEDYSTLKGINILNGLQLQFGGSGGTPGFERTVSSTDGVTTESITRRLTIPSINYSLNIVNTNTSRSEILARPTLIGLKGQPSVFFSGLDITAAANTGSGGGLASSSIQIQKEIGVRLGIIPNVEADGRVRLQVEANRSFLRTPSQSVAFDFVLETTKTTVNANVLMNFGETLILSGLSEKETGRSRDGVPGLQEVPVLQYLFSRRDTRDFQRSVLILLTPRLPQYVYKVGGVAPSTGDPKADEAMAELRARYGDWFTPYPNWASVFHHMQANSLYREFRTGDVSLERWQDQESLSNRLKTALDFLYF